MRRRIKVVTLGCSKNTVDTEHLLAQLPADAFDIVDGNGPVDCLLLNTLRCPVSRFSPMAPPRAWAT